MLVLLLNLVNFLVNTPVKIHVDSVICVILPQEVQTVQNVQPFATLVSINVTVYAKLERPNVQHLVLQQQLQFKLRLLFPEHRKFKQMNSNYYNYYMNIIRTKCITYNLISEIIKIMRLKFLWKPANLTVKKHVIFATCVPLIQLRLNVQHFANLAKKNVLNTAQMVKKDV